MNPHPSMPFGWHNDGTAYGQQVHGLLGGSSQMPSNSAAFEASYQIPFAADMANEAQPSNDVSMANYETEPQLGPQPGPSIHRAQRNARPSRRARSEHLDWNAYKDTIKELYIDQNKSLPETMAVMNEQYSFNAS